jgi:hypothetical protein
MRKDPWGFGLALLGLLFFAPPVDAKRPLEKVTIAGQGLRSPVEITDELTLRIANPWFGTFVDWNAPPAKPRNHGLVYDVILHARLRSSDLRPIYRFRYAPGAGGDRGLIYLPGRGEPWHRENVSIIIRDGHDGRWNPASPEWDARVKAALAR